MICFVVRSRTKALCHSPQVGRSRIPCQKLQTLVAAGLKRTKIISFPHKPNRFLPKNYGSRSKKGEFLRFELSHNALNRKPQK